MHHLIFKIVKQKSIKICLSDKFMEDFPVHEHYMVEVEEKVIIYKFNPTRKTHENIEQLKTEMMAHFKRKYNAYSVEVGTLQNQIDK